MKHEMPLPGTSGGISGFAGLANALSAAGLDAAHLMNPYSLGGIWQYWDISWAEC